MKDLKFAIANDLYQGFTELNNLLQVYKFYIESMAGKQKDESFEEFIDSQMVTLESVCSSHLKKIKENLSKSAFEWKNKNKIQQE